MFIFLNDLLHTAFLGINAGLYAKELMENCERLVSESLNGSGTKPDQIINRSAVDAISSGSSTVLVAYFDGQVCS